MKKVFLEHWCRLTVNLSSPDACLLKEDLCLPVVALTSLSDSLADSWDAVVTTRLLSFFHVPHHLAQSSLHPSPVWERSQKVAPSEGFPPKPLWLLPGISERLALLLEVRGDQLAGLRIFAQHKPEVLGSSDTLLCLGSFPGSKKGEKAHDHPILALAMGLPHGPTPCATQRDQLKDSWAVCTWGLGKGICQLSPPLTGFARVRLRGTGDFCSWLRADIHLGCWNLSYKPDSWFSSVMANTEHCQWEDMQSSQGKAEAKRKAGK